MVICVTFIKKFVEDLKYKLISFYYSIIYCVIYYLSIACKIYLFKDYVFDIYKLKPF